jgi:hypothetical protein
LFGNPELPDNLAAEGGKVARIAENDQVAVHGDLPIHPPGAGVLRIVPYREEAGCGFASQDTGGGELFYLSCEGCFDTPGGDDFGDSDCSFIYS